MSVPRTFLKQLVTEVGLFEGKTYSGGLLAGAIFTTDVLNLTMAGFLNPFGVADPGTDDIIAPGHVVYWYLYYEGAGSAVTVDILARASTADTRRIVPSLSTAVAVATPRPFRTDLLGAVWDCSIRLTNSGGSAVSAFQLAIGARAR